MTAGLVTVFGGSGFIGRYVVQRVAERGWQVRVAVRPGGVTEVDLADAPWARPPLRLMPWAISALAVPVLVFLIFISRQVA